MNFFDAYDVSGTTTSPATTQPQPTLNEEVTQVVGQLSRFWGGFRKQSQTVLESARKDLGDVVQQAQKELTKLTEAAPTSSSEPEADSSPTEKAVSPDAEGSDAASVPSTSPDPHTTSDDAAPASSSSASESSQPQTLFSRLQASLPPSLVTTVQSQLPETLKETLKHARVGSANLTALDFAQLRSTITSELQRVQGATEGYVHRSEEFLREAGEFLKDAVKVVPPEEGDSGYSGLIWDGTDVWMLPTGGDAEPPSSDAAASKGKGKEREGSASSGRPSVDTLRAVATRAESMLKQLRHDPAVIKADPKEDENVRDMYSNWLAAEAASEDRGLGTTAWQNKVERALADPVDGSALKATLDALVPETLTQEEFWTRYFFRVHQVEREEARRKAIIQGTNENDDDFSWEDDEEDATSPTMKAQPAAAESTTPTAPAAHLSPPVAENKSRASTPGHTSPRQSSEDSYDVVSSQVSSVGAAETATLKAKVPEKKAKSDDGEEDDEDEDEDEDEDDDEEKEEEEGEVEEESDWE